MYSDAYCTESFFCLIFSNVCHVSVSVISSSRQLTEVAKVLGRTAIYSVEHSRWLIFFFTFGVSVLIEMEPVGRYWV